MKGTIIKRGKKWSIVIDIGRDETGKRIRKWQSGFATKREAEEERIEILSRLQRGSYVEPTKLTLAEFLREQWLPAKDQLSKPLRSRGTSMTVRRRSSRRSVRVGSSS